MAMMALNMRELLWVNGRIVTPRAAALSGRDAGFLFADGCYETVRVYGGRPYLWNQHLRRLTAGLRTLGIPHHGLARVLKGAAQRLIRASKGRECALRIVVSRGPDQGPAHPPPVRAQPTVVLDVAPVAPRDPALYGRGASAIWVRSGRVGSTWWTRAKTTQRVEQRLAQRSARARGAAEAVFVSPEGWITEGTVSNVFFVRGRILCTPALACGLLPGVTRDWVIAWARRRGMSVREGFFRPAALEGASEAFLTGSVREIMPLVRIGSRRIGRGRPGPVTADAAGAYRRAAVR